MLKSIKKNRDGFTIIEVLIVLAIAALIMIIVFLAVPALQRSARNTQRRTDVSAVVAAISNYISDNNGNVPNDITIATNKVATISCVPTTGTTLPTTSCDKTNPNTETAKMGYYTSNPVISATDASPTAPTTSTISNAQMYYDPDTSCNNNGAPSATTGAFTVWYYPEGGASVICLD